MVDCYRCVRSTSVRSFHIFCERPKHHYTVYEVPYSHCWWLILNKRWTLTEYICLCVCVSYANMSNILLFICIEMTDGECESLSWLEVTTGGKRETVVCMDSETRQSVGRNQQSMGRIQSADELLSRNPGILVERSYFREIQCFIAVIYAWMWNST